MTWRIVIHGEVVRERETREECLDIAIKQCWARRVPETGELVLYPGNEIVEVPPIPFDEFPLGGVE